MAEENIIQAVVLDEYVRPANTEVVDADQAKRQDQEDPASSEAECFLLWWDFRLGTSSRLHHRKLVKFHKILMQT